MKVMAGPVRDGARGGRYECYDREDTLQRLALAISLEVALPPAASRVGA